MLYSQISFVAFPFDHFFPDREICPGVVFRLDDLCKTDYVDTHSTSAVVLGRGTRRSYGLCLFEFLGHRQPCHSVYIGQRGTTSPDGFLQALVDVAVQAV